jgi:hypothetical protein
MLSEERQSEELAVHSSDRSDEDSLVAAGRRAWEKLRKGSDFEAWSDARSALAETYV